MAQVAKASARDRLIDAAFQLFDERGYERTTVDDIAERAGVGRTTFFRNYRSKEDVIFPDHAHLVEAIQRRLAASSSSTAIVAVTEAVRLVLLWYIDEGDRARSRYALTSRISVLRDREIASVAQYQRVFREFIATWMGNSQESALRAELMAASVVAAHNHVLRRWLRGDTADPLVEIDVAMAQVVALFPADPPPVSAHGPGSTIVVLQAPYRVDEILPALRKAIESV